MAEAMTQPAAAPTNPTAPSPADPDLKKPDAAEPDATVKFQGNGVSFRAKIIGIEDVPDNRGDKMCQDSILKLKGNVKVSGQHKQKIVINISMSGIKLIDVMTAQVLHEHRVDRISFIARDLTDRRAFGYIVGDDEARHQFYAMKTAKVAEQVVLVLRDLFQVVYNRKQKEMETAKAQSQTDEPQQSSQPTTPNAQSEPRKEGNIMNLEQQLENMQQMSDMDAFKTSWPANSPTTPDTSNTGTDSDMFGMANSASGGSGIARNASYSDDLAGFNMEALQPAANGGAKLTKDQILAGFGQGPAVGGMYQQQPQVAAHPFTGQQVAYSSPPMSPQFGAPFGAAPQAPISGFPVGPRPAVPVRSGAMRPPVPFQAQPNPAQSPFGDVQSAPGVLAPTNMQPELINGSSATNDEKPRYDPFGSLLPGLGKSEKKDMFKNFQMAKPPSKSDLQQDISNSQNNVSPPKFDQSSGDPFASMTNSNFGETLNADNNKQQQQQTNNFDALFG